MSIGTTEKSETFLLSDVSWATYKKLREEVSDGLRLTYDRGKLEIMSPSRRHENIKTYIGRMIETIDQSSKVSEAAGD